MEAIEGFAAKKAFAAECGLVGKSEAIHEVIETSLQIALTDAAVLITGESGTGKELVAQAIHKHGPRRFGPFVPLNCGGIAEGVLESELFGHEKGSFTGALSRHKGVFEAAHGGTIFLDEIGEMSLPVQVRLLRVLEQKEFRRVGGTEPIKVDVRVISASNKDLRRAIQNNEFRRDLYYRLKVVQIHVPPLRERREDIRLLIDAFIEQYCKEHSVGFAGISENALRMLEKYSWPGNVRELRNLVESMIVLSPRSQITETDIPAYLDEQVEVERNLPMRLNKTPEQSERELIYRALIEVKRDVEEVKAYLFGQRRVDLPPYRQPSDAEFSEDTGGDREPTRQRAPSRPVTLEEMTKEMIEQALGDARGNRKQAARTLGVSVRTLYRKLKAYGLS
jgi:DNA-binding NtrC family response regulator